MDRKYSARHEGSLIEKMEKIYGYYDKEGIGLFLGKSDLLSSHPSSRDNLGIFLFEEGSESAIVHERHNGVVIPSHYHVELLLIGENPEALKKKLENDLEMEFSISG